MHLSAENNPSGDHDEDKDNNLDHSKDVHEFDTEIRGKGMDARNGNDYRKCDPSFSPFGHVVICCN